MKKIDIVKIIKKKSWYKQGGASSVLYISFPWSICNKITYQGKKIKPQFLLFGAYFKGLIFLYWGKNEMKKIAEFYWKLYYSNPASFKKEITRWNNTVFGYMDWAHGQVTSNKLRSLSQRGLVKLFREFTERYNNIWKAAIFLDAFDFAGELLLEKELARTKKKLSAEELHLMTLPERFSVLQTEAFQLLLLARLAQKNQILKKLILSDNIKDIEKKFPNFYIKVKIHAELYDWIYNDYSRVVFLKPKDFFKRIKDLLKEPHILKRDYNHLKEVKTITQKKKKIIKRHNLPKHFVIFCEMISELALWRDSRKSMNQKSNVFVERFVANASYRLKISKKHLRMYFWHEILTLLKGKKINQGIIKKRYISGLWKLEKLPTGLLTGKEAINAYKLFEQEIACAEGLKGMVAFPGNVRGTVKIINQTKDFKKMKKGDILVAPNTRPEYIPIMKLAGAIISVEGGVTCHSAIVSRELKIPCIVGVQAALSQLHDGDKVVVDAQNGIVMKVA